VSFMRRIIGGGEPVPDWARFFSAERYRAFIAAVERDIGRRGLQFRLRDGYLEMEGDAEQQLGLANLAQVCNSVDEAEWPAVIDTHFSTLLAGQGGDLGELAADFNQAQPLLRVRLFPDESMGGTSLGRTVARPLAPGVIEALVYDFPDTTTGVPRDHLAGWPVSEDEATAIARKNALAEPVTRSAVELAKGVSLELCEGNFYVASHVFGLGDLLPPGNSHGAVVALPNRHSLIWFPIEDLRVIRALTGMLPIATGLFDTGPGSISNQLYWWRDGELIHLPVAQKPKGTLAFAPPDEFLALLNSFPALPAPG
jgi:hypothetical protein